jgi:GGDEF domain-containing protein
VEFRGKFVAILLLMGWRLFLMSVLTLPLITISLFVSVAVLITWLGFQYDRMYFIATHDASTGLYNREYALQQIKSMLRDAQRLQIPLSILIIDANNLKHVNDTYGHLAGDQGIRMVARTLKSYTTNRDVAARLGGDEFIVIHPGGDRGGQ